MKIAIPVKIDEQTIEARMGHAPLFAVYTIEEDGSTQKDVFTNEHAGHHHNGNHENHAQGHHGGGIDTHEVNEHRRHLGILTACTAVIVRGIGPNMKMALQQKDIQIYRAKRSLGDQADDLIKDFQSNL